MSNDLEDLELFREFARTRRRATRNALVERHMGLAAHVAKRFAHTGRTDDDLRQVAMIGLVKAVDRFDPEYGASFSSYAGLTIEGELKRYFRDKTWTVKVPRSAKELHLLVRNAAADLEQETGRSPGVAELADHLGIERDDVLRGLAANAASSVAPLDRESNDEEPGAIHRQSALATVDRAYADRENDIVVSELMDRLPEREREIVRLRFYENMSQTEIADEVGISQMHVSRLLRRSFEQMRRWMKGSDLADPAASAD